MADCKEKFVKSIGEVLICRFSDEDVQGITDVIVKALKNYDVLERERSIVLYDGINENILKRYCACLMIGGKSEKTIYQYKRTAERLYRANQKNYTDMDVYDIRLFLATEKSRGVSSRTLENTRANLSAFFQWLALEELVQKNPCIGVTPIKYTEKVRLPFSNVEIDKLRFACKTDKERALIEVLLSSGMRVSELAAVRLSDVNFEKLSIHVRNGKGGKERTVYINSLAKAHLEKYLGSRQEHGDMLFYNKKHDPLNAGGVRYVLNVIAKRAGVFNVHPHRFRRTFASGLADRGMDIQEIKKLLGHSDINTTLEYVYTSDESVRNSYEKYTA